MENDKKVGEFIKELRKEKRMTQSDLALKLNVTNKAVSRWECGEGMPDVSTLGELAKNLNISVDELLQGERRAYITTSNKKKILNFNTITFISAVILLLGYFVSLWITYDKGKTYGSIILLVAIIIGLSIYLISRMRFNSDITEYTDEDKWVNFRNNGIIVSFIICIASVFLPLLVLEETSRIMGYEYNTIIEFEYYISIIVPAFFVIGLVISYIVNNVFYCLKYNYKIPYKNDISKSLISIALIILFVVLRFTVGDIDFFWIGLIVYAVYCLLMIILKKDLMIHLGGLITSLVLLIEISIISDSSLWDNISYYQYTQIGIGIIVGIFLIKGIVQFKNKNYLLTLNVIFTLVLLSTCETVCYEENASGLVTTKFLALTEEAYLLIAVPLLILNVLIILFAGRNPKEDNEMKKEN